MSNAVRYTDVDLNATGTTTIYDPDHDASAYGVFLLNSGNSAAYQVEVTDGTDTSVLTAASGGNNLNFDHVLPLDGSNSLQINVTTAEGSALTATASVFVGQA